MPPILPVISRPNWADNIRYYIMTDRDTSYSFYGNDPEQVKTFDRGANIYQWNLEDMWSPDLDGGEPDWNYTDVILRTEPVGDNKLKITLEDFSGLYDWYVYWNDLLIFDVRNDRGKTVIVSIHDKEGVAGTLHKPSWLANWLLLLNWSILGWEINVGDAIEAAIDWVIDSINYVLGLASEAWSIAQEVWSQLTDFYNALVALITEQVAEVWNWLSTLWNDLEDWIATKLDIVKEWLEALRFEVLEWLDSFLTFDWLFSWWSDTWQTILDWFNVIKDNILDIVDLKFKDLIDTINTILDFIDMVKEFLTNPLQYLWDRFLNWFLGDDSYE